jgi:hypothetical protein
MSAQNYARAMDEKLVPMQWTQNALHVNHEVGHEWKDVLVDQYDEKGILQKSAFDLRNELVDRMAVGPQKDAYALSPDEVTSIQKQIMSILRWKAKSDLLIDPVNVGAGMLTREYYTGNDVTKPRLTRTFQGGYNVMATKSKSSVELYGLDYDISIDKVSLDAGNSTQNKVHLQPSLQAFESQVIMESLVQYREWWIHRGSDVPNMVDVGIKGICNWTGITDPGSLGLGADNDLRAAGDVDYSATVIAEALIKAKFEPPFELHMTPLVYGRALKNKNATTGKTDMGYILDLNSPDHGGVKMFNSIRINPYLIDSATETVGTGAMLGMKKLPTTENYVAEAYPLGVYPMNKGNLGWDAKILWLGGTVLQRPTAIAYKGTLTTGT